MVTPKVSLLCRLIAAARTVGPAAEGNQAAALTVGVNSQYVIPEWGTLLAENFYRFQSHQPTHLSHQWSEYPFGSATGLLRRWWAMKETAQTGGLAWKSSHQLTTESDSCPMDQGNTQCQSGIVGLESGGKVIRTIQYQITVCPLCYDLFNSLQSLNDRLNLEIRSVIPNSLPSSLRLGLAQVIKSEENLTMEVGELHLVRVNQYDFAKSGSLRAFQERQDRRTAQSPCSDHQNSP
jgi:hypothetical protein